MSNGWAEEGSAPPVGKALFVVALVPRLWAALTLAGEPVWDGHYYDFGARRIASGAGYSDDLTIGGHILWHPWCHYPVGYSAILAPLYQLLGADAHVAPVFNAFTGALLAVVTWALAGHALSPLRARAAGLIVALHPGLILYSALVMTEPLAALLTLTAFWLAVRDRGRFRGLVIGALVLGVGALVRPQALLCAPFLALVMKTGDANIPPVEQRITLFRRLGSVWSSRLLPRVVPMAAACAIALLPVLPWTARNCRVMDGCALVSTNAGWNLAIGAFPRATGRFETLKASDGCRDVTGQVQQDRCWFAYGVAEIEKDWSRWLGLIPSKLAYTFDHESFAVEYLHEARPESWPPPVRVGVRGLTTLVERLLVCASALGVVALVLPSRAPRPRLRVAGTRSQSAVLMQGGLLVLVVGLIVHGCSEPLDFWPVVLVASIVPWLPVPGRAAWPPALTLPVALLVTTVLTHAVFFGEDRYHIVVVPVLALLTACIAREPAGYENTH